MPDTTPTIDRLPAQAVEHLPMQAHVPALLPGVKPQGTVTAAGGATTTVSTFAATSTALDMGQFSTVWTDNFDGSFGHMDRRWGDVTLSGGMALVRSSAASGWAASGMMQAPTGASAGEGYGLYTIRAKTDANAGPGPYACLWPSTDGWPGPELDMFEKASQSNTDGYSTIHWAGTDPNGKPTNEYNVYMLGSIDMSQFHTFAMDWEADHIAFYVDGTLVWTTTEHVPKSLADGGQNESFGAGMQPAWAAAYQSGSTNTLTVDWMSYAAPAAKPAAIPAISVSDASGTEGASLTFTVSLSAASTQPVSVKYATAGGTAVSGTDFSSKSGTLSFAAGETSKTVSVTTKQDSTAESNETMALHLSSASGGTIARADGTGTIIDDDAPPSANVISGTSSNNTLTGTAGDDTITGGGGADTMTGGGGADDFVFAAGDGYDRITDFQPGVDDLVFRGFTASQLTVKAATHSGIAGTEVFYGSGTSNHVFLQYVVPGNFSVAQDVIFA